MFIRLLMYTILISTIGLLIGCSSGGSITSPSNNTPNGTTITSLPIGITDRFSDGSPYAGTGVLGLFNLTINKSELRAELVPLRKQALTDVLEVVDITNFLQLAPCTDCAKIKSASLDLDGNLVLSIGIKHPFEAGDPFEPISGKNRADLHVFNIEGTILSSATGVSFPGMNESIAGFSLLNADGFSPYLDDVLDDIYTTEATIHPYILHFDDYSAGNFNPLNEMGFESVTNPPPSGNLVMAMGCDYNYQDYVFKLGNSTADFIFAVGCTYGVSAASKPQRFSPEYRVPQHNKKAASEVDIEIITNDLRGGDNSSTAEIQIKVVDISHGVAVGDALNEMFADSSVSTILVEIPGITISSISLDVSSPSGSGHDPSDPLVYSATITNEASGAEGSYIGLVKVIDSYSPGQNSSLLLNGMDGIERVDPLANPLDGLFDLDEFATYQVFSIDVATGNLPPVAILAPDPATIYQYQEIEFDATASYDTDGTITLYEFDFHYDGNPSSFEVEESNTTGLVTYEYITPDALMACVRVTDDMGAQSYDSVDVTINPCGDTITSYDMTLPEMATGRFYSGTIVVDDQLWIMGGEWTYSVEVFDLETETWDTTPHAPMPSMRTGFGIAHYNGKIYCMGGYYSGRLRTQDVYDIESNTWDTTHPILPGVARNVCREVVYRDEIYLCYGLIDGVIYPAPCARLDIYDPNTREWRRGADAPCGRSSPIWVVVGDKIWGFGNHDMTDPNPGWNLIEYYEPSSDTWTSLDPSITFTRWRGTPGYIAVGDDIYVVGGSENDVNAYAWVDVFDTVNRTWSQQMDLPEDRGWELAVAYYHCRLYVGAGGTDATPPDLPPVLRSIRAAIFE